MDKQLFENTLAEFLNKAGVTLLKNGTDYNSIENIVLPAYILVDSKRHSIYLAETNSDDIDVSEITEQISSFSEENSISSDTAKAVTALGRDYKNFPKDFKIDSLTEDLSNFTIKTSLVLTEELKNETVNFLKSKNINFQNADYKNKLSVFFFDLNNSQQIADIYNSLQSPDTADVPAENNLSQEQEAGEEISDDIEPVFQPKENNAESTENTNSINNIDINSIPANDNTGIEYIPEENKEDDDDELNPDDEAMLENLDIAALTAPAAQEDEPKDSVEEELLYGKILKEQSDIAAQNQTKSIEGTFNPENMQEIRNEPAKNVTFNSKEENNKTAEKQPADRKKFAFFDIPNKIASNIIGILFFLPVYILNKLTGRFLPPFVIYWIGALPAIFGFYQLVLPFFPRPLGSILESTAKNTTNAVDKFISGIQSASDNVTSSASFLMEQDKMILLSQKDVIDMMSSGGWLLHYMLGFAAVLMIIPVFRTFGKTLTIFSMLTYFLIPSVVKIQSIIINYALHLENMTKTAAILNFSAGVFPYIALIIIFYISAQLIPDSNKRKEVLPC